MRVVVLSIFSLFLMFSPLIRAEDKSLVDSQMVGMVNTVKFMAKAYIMSADLDKIKTKNIDKIKQISDAEFKQNYALAYSYIGQSQMPAGFKANMSKKQVIAVIRSLNKEKISKMIDEIDSDFIATELRKQMAANGKNGEKFNMQAVTKVWADISKQIN